MNRLNLALIGTMIATFVFIFGAVMIGGFFCGVFVLLGSLTGYVRNDVDRARKQKRAEKQKRQDAREAAA